MVVKKRTIALVFVALTCLGLVSSAALINAKTGMNLPASEQIKEIIENYFWAVDMRDIDGLMALFHEDAEVTFFGTPGVHYVGTELIRGLFTGMITLYPNIKHVAYSIVVKEIADGEATGKVRWMVSLGTAEAPGTTIDFWGYDDFTFKRTEGTWKIIKLDIILWPSPG